jgi:eukaryotic-like serine/threonine-protein kinase
MGTVVHATKFGPYELRPRSRELYKFGSRVRLRPQPFQVLSLLLDRAGEVVTREQLRQQLWPSDTFVDFEHSLNTAIKELRGVLNDSASNSRYIQTHPKLGYRFIFPVEQSLPNVQPIVASAPVEPQLSQRPTLAASAPVLASVTVPRRTLLSIVAAAVLLLGIGIVVARMGVFRRSASGAASAALKPRPSVAVLGFKNLSRKPDEEWMSTAMAEMLGAELASGQQIRVIPGENVARMKLDLSLPATDTYGRETLDKIRNHLSIDMVASGSYLALSEGSTSKLRIVLQVQDTRTGETIAAFTKDGSESDLAQLISAGGEDLRRTLGIGSLSAAAAREVRASVPSNSEAERFYAEGLAKLHGFDALAARALLEKAIAADPNHALSHAALAESLFILGNDLNAQEEARKALDLSTNLSREDRLSIEGRYRDLTNDRPAALEIYRTLHAFFPDNLDYGLRFARAQIRAGYPADALHTVEALRSLPEPEGKDARIGLMEASASERLGDMKRSQQAAAASAARAQAQGSGLMLANAIDSEAWAWNNLGEPDKAIADDTRARELWLAAGDTRNAAKALHGIAIDQKDKGDLVEARKSFEEALKEFRRVGANWDIASCSHNLGLLFAEQGELELAKSYLEEALRIQRSQNDKRGVSSDLDDLGNVALSSGELSSAKQLKEEALQGFRDIGDKRGESITLVNLGEVLYQQGNLNAATEEYDQAMVLQKEVSRKTGLAYSLAGLAEVLTAEDRLGEALSSAQQSLALHEQNKEEKYAAESDLQLGEIALDQGNTVEAESLARQAVSVFEKSKAPGSASLAYSLFARSLLARGKLGDARAAADRAIALAHQGSDLMIRMEAGLAEAEVDARSSKVAEAERNLNILHNQAKRDGYVTFELETRLLLAKTEIQSGKHAVGRARLDKLQSDARSRGFLLIARQASASVPTTP